MPWELATIEPVLDAFGAAVPRGPGRRRPVGVRLTAGPRFRRRSQSTRANIAVVSGVYPDTAWRLVDAEEEAATLVELWHATSVDAAATTIIECLKGQPPADVLHFAVHGTYAPEGVLEGLILVDGERLDPMVVKGCALDRAPFVFLNACQVGSSNEVLGDYSGLAEAFLHAGAAAVIAPLWSIDDAAAKELALRFYGRVFGDGVPPAVGVARRAMRVRRTRRRRRRDPPRLPVLRSSCARAARALRRAKDEQRSKHMAKAKGICPAHRAEHGRPGSLPGLGRSSCSGARTTPTTWPAIARSGRVRARRCCSRARPRPRRSKAAIGDAAVEARRRATSSCSRTRATVGQMPDATGRRGRRRLRRDLGALRPAATSTTSCTSAGRSSNRACASSCSPTAATAAPRCAASPGER